MAHKKSRHLSRIAAPKSWPIKRKQNKWISRPDPGAQRLATGMPLAVFLTEILGYTRNKAEVKKVLNQKLVFVNGKIIKEPNFFVGLFDTMRILKYNKLYRVLLNQRGKLMLTEIPSSEENIIPLRVEGKTTIKGGKVQVNLSNGWNFITDKDVYKVTDVVLFDSKERKPSKHLKMEKGNLVYVIGGTHSGKVSEIKDFVHEGMLRKKKFVVAKHNEEKLKIPIKDVFVIGVDKPEIQLQ